MFHRIPRPFEFTALTLAMLGVLVWVPPARAQRLATPQWTNVTSLTATSSRPQPRKHHIMMMDPVGNQIIMWGGEQNETLLDGDCVWILDLCTMQWRRQTTGPSSPSQRPSPRHGHSAVILPEQRKLIVMMGSTQAGVSDYQQGLATVNDVWELNLNTFNWSLISPAGTLPCRRWHAAVTTFGATSANASIFLFGGRNPAPSLGNYPFAINDTWLLKQTGTTSAWQWTLAAGPDCSPLPDGGDGNHPDRRYKQSLISGRGLTATADTLYSFGGVYGESDPSSNVFRGSVNGTSVTWDDPEYSIVTVTPHARAEHSAIFDPIAARMIMFGGFIPPDASGDERPVNTLSSMSILPTCPNNNCWSLLSTNGQGPSARKGHAAVYDPNGDRMIVFGGQLTGPAQNPAEGSPTDETWVLSFLPSTAVATISDARVQSYTSTTATLRWTLPNTLAAPNGPGTVCKWDLRWSLGPISTDADFSAATPITASYSLTPTGTGTWHVDGNFTVPSPTVAKYWAVRPFSGSTTQNSISNAVCFKLSPYLPCMEELRTDLEGPPPAASRLLLSVPNPVGRSFECSITVPEGEAAVLSMHDVAGRSVERHELGTGTGSRLVKLGETASLRPGFYMVILRQGVNESRKSVIVR